MAEFPLFLEKTKCKEEFINTLKEFKMTDDDSMDVDSSPDYTQFTTTSFRNYQISRRSEFQKLDDDTQKLKVHAYMDTLETMNEEQLQKELKQHKRIALRASLTYTSGTSENILESGKLRIVEAVIKNKFSDGLPKEDVAYREVPNYLQEELLPQLDAYQKKIETLPIEDLSREKDVQTIRSENTIPNPTSFDKKRIWNLQN